MKTKCIKCNKEGETSPCECGGKLFESHLEETHLEHWEGDEVEVPDPVPSYY